MPGPPSRPAESMPTPPTQPMTTAPPRGKRSEATASMVGQKNVLPTPSPVTASRQNSAPLALPSSSSPAAAMTAQLNSSPSGVSTRSTGPAKNRSANISVEVYTNRSRPSAPSPM